MKTTLIFLCILIYKSTAIAGPDLCKEMMCSNALVNIGLNTRSQLTFGSSEKPKSCNDLHHLLLTVKSENGKTVAYAFLKDGIFKFALGDRTLQKANFLQKHMYGAKEKMVIAKLNIPGISEPQYVKFDIREDGTGDLYPAPKPSVLNPSADIEASGVAALNEPNRNQLTALLKSNLLTIPNEFSEKRSRMSYGDGIKAQANEEKEALILCKEVEGLKDDSDLKNIERSLPAGPAANTESIKGSK